MTAFVDAVRDLAREEARTVAREEVLARMPPVGAPGLAPPLPPGGWRLPRARTRRWDAVLALGVRLAILLAALLHAAVLALAVGIVLAALFPSPRGGAAPPIHRTAPETSV